MPNVCLEVFASMWISSKRQVMRDPPEQQLYKAQEDLEECMHKMERQEREKIENVIRLSKEAVQKKKAGDTAAAKMKLAQRRSAAASLQKLRHSMHVIETHLDNIRSSELDKEIMMSLKTSSEALKKAGVGFNISEVENVMTELDDHMQDMKDITSVLSAPINHGTEDDTELESELERLMNAEDEETASVLQKTAYKPHMAPPENVNTITSTVAASTLDEEETVQEPATETSTLLAQPA